MSSVAVKIAESIISAEMALGKQYKLSHNQIALPDFANQSVLEIDVPDLAYSVVEEVVVDLLIQSTTNSIDGFIPTTFLNAFRVAIESSKGVGLINFWKTTSVIDAGEGIYLIQLCSTLSTVMQGTAKVAPSAQTNPNYTVTFIGGYIQIVDLLLTPNAQ